MNIPVGDIKKIMGISISNLSYFMGLLLTTTPVFPGSWDKKHKLVIESDYIDAELSNFPIKLDENCLDPEIFDYALNGGADIRFSFDENGTTQIACEIVSFDTVSSGAEIYVKIPTVDSTSDTEFWIWYQCPNASQVDASSTYGSKNVWDSDFKLVSHMKDRLHLLEIEDSITGMPNNAAWQGVGTDGTNFYVTTSLNITSGNENSIRKYRISDGQLVDSAIGVYDDTYAFSSCNVIDGKLMIAVRGPTGNEDWGHVVEYDLDDLSELADHDVSLENYWFAEGVDKRGNEYWVMYGGENGGGNDKCAVARFNSEWAHQETYDLFTISAGYGYQDIWWDSDYIYGNMHEGDGVESFDKWYFNGTTFTKVRQYTPIADNGALAGQGFCYLNGYWYFACRYADKIKKAQLTINDTLYVDDMTKNIIDIKKGSVDNPVQSSNAQDFSSDYLTLTPKPSFVLATTTIECFINPDSFLSADEGKNTLVFLNSQYYLQVRGDVGNVGKVAIYVNAGLNKGYHLSSSALSTGQDKYIAFRFTGTKAYVNFGGNLEVDISTSGTPSASTYPMNIGAENSPLKRYYDGKIMEVRISEGSRSNAWVDASRITIETPSTFCKNA